MFSNIQLKNPLLVASLKSYTNKLKTVKMRCTKFSFIFSVAMLLLPFSGYVHAQTDSLKPELSYKSQIKFSLTGCIYDNLKLDWFGEKILRSLPLPSGEVTISYYNYLKNGYGVNVGLGLGLAPFNIHHKETPANNNLSVGPLNHCEYVQEYYILPVSVQKIFNSKKNINKIHFFEAGLRVNYKVAHPYSIEVGETIQLNDSTDIRIFLIDVRSTPNRTIISYFIKYGWQKTLRNQNTFQYNLVLHYSPSKIGRGNYEFTNLPYPSLGTVSQNINYLGFEVVYGLTTSRRMKTK